MLKSYNLRYRIHFDFPKNLHTVESFDVHAVRSIVSMGAKEKAYQWRTSTVRGVILEEGAGVRD